MRPRTEMRSPARADATAPEADALARSSARLPPTATSTVVPQRPILGSATRVTTPSKEPVVGGCSPDQALAPMVDASTTPANTTSQGRRPATATTPAETAMTMGNG